MGNESALVSIRYTYIVVFYSNVIGFGNHFHHLNLDFLKKIDARHPSA